MAWFSGKVSLGNFPDLAGAVNKLSESVKNIEKNFDTALGFEEKSDKSESTSEASGLWPVMSFMGHKSEEGTPEEKREVPTVEKKEDIETDTSQNSPTEQTVIQEENEALRIETAEQMDHVILDVGKAGSESQSVQVEPPETIPLNVETLNSANEMKQEYFEVKPYESSESIEVESKVVEVDQVDGGITGFDESDDTVNINEDTDEHKIQGTEIEEQSSPVEAQVKSDKQEGYGTEAVYLIPASADGIESAHELSFPTKVPSNDDLETVSELISHEKDANSRALEVHQDATLEVHQDATLEVHQDATDSETVIKDEEQRLSSANNASDTVHSLLELEKVKIEMKMMESALQGAARQAQAKADEIAKLMNENEQLKAVIEDLKRNSNEAEIESLREEYHQRVETLERKVYALTRERDTLRREQNRKSDAAALLKEKDEIITQVMAEGEELSKKQAAQEATMRKLRAQIRELEEEKKGLITKLQVEENKVESIKKDKTATEKLLQETIEKHQAELAVQKDYYTNALVAAKEAEALAEVRANNEARSELESRLREAEEREAMLVQALEELRQTLSRKEQQAVFREDMLRRDIEDLQKRYQASERRCEELITQVPESTRPLLRQIEAMQETTTRRAEAWAAVDRSLNSRLQEAEAKAASAEERERSINERLSQTLSRINVLEAQISCLRAEQTQLGRSLEKERQRAAENRQEYLAAKEEADTQEGRAKQLEEEIKELRRKHKQELQDALMHRELLQQEVEREKAARLDLERTAQVQSTTVSEHGPITRHNSMVENGHLSHKLSSASSIGSMEESYFLQASLDSSDGISERRNAVEATMSPYYIKSMTPSTFEATLRQKEGELASYMSRLASLESIRDSLAEELVKMTAQCEKLRAEATMLPGIRAELEALRRRHAAALELMGERDEELEELRADIVDLKEMYREQVNMLVNQVQILSSSMGNP